MKTKGIYTSKVDFSTKNHTQRTPIISGTLYINSSILSSSNSKHKLSPEEESSFDIATD